MIEYIKENEIPYLFIAGDLYDHEYVRQSTIDFINDCFKQILNTKIYIIHVFANFFFMPDLI